MKKITTLLFVLCLYLSGYAQDAILVPGADSLPKPKYIIKFAPLSLMDIDPTVQFGLEYLAGDKWGLQQELGYGHFNFSAFSPNGDDMQQKEVWRSRTEARLYLDNYRPRPRGAYLAFEVLYKRVNYIEDVEIGRDCENGDCAYEELVQNKVLKDVWGFHFKVGGQTVIGKRIALDFYVGVGGRSVHVQATNKELEAIWKEDHQIMVGNPSRPGTYGLFSANLGFKVGYLLFKQ